MEEDGMEGFIKSQEEGIEKAEITLYALVGSPTPGTMRVNGMIIGEGLIILLDSGSTHNFIDDALLPKLQLSMDVTQILEVKVANRDVIKTQEVCRDVEIQVQGYTFMVQLHVLPLEGCEVVLGTYWLSTLGVINWDFKLLTIEFHHWGQQVVLQGIKVPGSNF